MNYASILREGEIMVAVSYEDAQWVGSVVVFLDCNNDHLRVSFYDQGIKIIDPCQVQTIFKCPEFSNNV